MPRTLKHYIYAAIALSALYAWLGWLEPPGARAAQIRDEWVKAHAAATARIDAADRHILILQERDAAAAAERKRVLDKLDEMAMVLYSMDRRTR